ncbi:MAG TPA: Uma2 family endonuclease [Pseudonocardiaceae bacterium]|nr:Uma2 family endonuclease [Pseudonocardiaceae bacterium]
MTAIPRSPLTVEDYLALGEDEHRRCELQEGSLVLSPSPRPHHVRAVGRLYQQLVRQVPEGLDVLLEIDVDLQLEPAGEPGTVRRPDLIVVDGDVPDRAESEGRLIRASEVVVVIEIASLSSRRLDTVIKRGEYAEAGIGYYWIVGIGSPVPLLPYHLNDRFGYVTDGGIVTGSFQTGTPFPVDVDLTVLR